MLGNQPEGIETAAERDLKLQVQRLMDEVQKKTQLNTVISGKLVNLEKNVQ